MAYCDSTIAFPLFCEYVGGLPSTAAGRARSWCTSATRSWPRSKQEAKSAAREHPEPDDPIETMPDLERHR